MSLALARVNKLQLWTTKGGFNRSHISKLAVLIEKKDSMSWGDSLRKAWSIARYVKQKVQNSLWTNIKPIALPFFGVCFLLLFDKCGML